MKRGLAVACIAAAPLTVASEAGAQTPPPRVDALREQLAKERKDWDRERLKLRRIKAPTIRTAAMIANAVYRVPVRGLMALAWCESRHDPGARNATALADGSHASGFTQIATPGTWNWTPYRRLSPFDITANVLAAGWIWRYRGGTFAEWKDVCAGIGDRA